MKSTCSNILGCLFPMGKGVRVVGLELGAAHCRCVTTMDDNILAEPSLALHTETKERSRTACVGEAVNHALCPGPGRVRFTRLQPFASPQTLDPAMVGLFLAHFRQQAEQRYGKPSPARLVLTAAPALLSHIQPLLSESAASAGFRSVETVSEADCLQAALAASDERPALMVDIGETATRLYRMDGDRANLSAVRAPGAALAAKDVWKFVHQRWRVLIGYRTVAHLLREGAPPDGKVRGRCIDNGLPKTFELGNADIVAALAPLFDWIAEAIHDCAAAQSRPGDVLLIGGGARMVGLAAYLESRLQLPLKVADTPENVLANDLRQLMLAGS